MSSLHSESTAQGLELEHSASQTLRTRRSSSVGSHVFSELRSYLYTLMFVEIHVISRLHPGEFRFTQLLHLLNAGQVPHSSRFHFLVSDTILDVVPLYTILSHYISLYSLMFPLWLEPYPHVCWLYNSKKIHLPTAK